MNLVNKRWARIHWPSPLCLRQKEKRRELWNISRRNKQGFIWSIISFPTEVQWGDKWEHQRWHRFSTGGLQRSKLPDKILVRENIEFSRLTNAVLVKVILSRQGGLLMSAFGKKQAGVKVLKSLLLFEYPSQFTKDLHRLWRILCLTVYYQFVQNKGWRKCLLAFVV